MLLLSMLSSRHFPFPSSTPAVLERATKLTWSTTATSEFDAVTANDEAGALGFHAATCQLANGGLRRVVDTLTAIGSILQARLISVVVVVTLAAAVAVLVVG